MTPRYDFAIFGGSPLAALLCGVLAHVHGKQVLQVSDPVPRQRLPRGLDFALPLATRPASWRLIRAAAAETARLLAGIEGQDRLDLVDVKLVADLPDTAIALAHLTHVAAGYGYASREGVFRQIARFSGGVDLTHSTVQIAETARTALTVTASGPELSLDGEAVGVGQIVLADDAAILERLPEHERPAQLLVQPAMTTLTMPTRRLPARVTRYLDRGVTLVQNDDRSVLALVTDEADADARLASCLTPALPLRRRATTHYRRVVTSDGAPLVGRLGQSQLMILAGLGTVAAFLAPPLARLLAGEPTEDERQWFAAHDPAASDRAAVADISEVWR
jgi:hypothetical protein